MYGKSSSSSLVSIPNEVRTDLWLSSTSDAERSVRLYVGFPGSELSPSSVVSVHDVLYIVKQAVLLLYTVFSRIFLFDKIWHFRMIRGVLYSRDFFILSVIIHVYRKILIGGFLFSRHHKNQTLAKEKTI